MHISTRYFDHHGRSVVKTITYRILIIVSHGVVMYVMTGDVESTLTVTGATSIVSTLIYFFHERVWNHIHWGKHEVVQNNNKEQ